MPRTTKVRKSSRQLGGMEAVSPFPDVTLPLSLPPAEPVAVRVARGASRFDDLKPGWAMKVDADRLDVQDAKDAPEAQVWGSVERGLVVIFRPKAEGQDKWKRACYSGTSVGQLVSLGLCANPENGDEYPEINAAWREEVRARQTVKESA